MMELANFPVDGLCLNDQAQKFGDHGYVVIENALPLQLVDTLRSAIEEIRPQLETSPHRQPTYGLSVRPMIDKHDVFLDLLYYPTTFPLVVKCLNHYSIQLMVSHLVEVPPNPDKRHVGWHDDGGLPALTVNGIRAFGSLKIGYSLTDVTGDDEGQLMVAPGSHRTQGAPPFDGADPIGAQTIKLRAGDAVLFQQGTWHAAAPNYSDKSRMNLYFGYNYRFMRPIDYDSFPAELIEKCTPIGKQLLGVKATHEGYYLPTEDDAPLKSWFEQHFGETSGYTHIKNVALQH